MPTPLEDYLNYYKTLTNPGYAVLVTGEWGAGKTYQVKNALKEDEIYYVSLFGVSTTAEARGEIFAQMLPKQTKLRNRLEIVGDIAKNFGSLGAMISTVPDVTNALLKREIKNDRIIVIDDLERSSLGSQKIQGLINTYVEHHECRVVVICHDEEIEDKFLATKEKIIGQTIRVEPEIDDAFSSFIREIKTDKGKLCLDKHKEFVVSIFKDSQSHSLRVLRHLMKDLHRFLSCLSDKHIQHDKAMGQIIPLFCALNIEVQHYGRIKKEHLAARNKAPQPIETFSEKDSKNGDKTPDWKIIRQASEKYKSTYLGSNMIDDDLAVDMFIRGYYDKSAIQKYLDNNPIFLEPAEEPVWKIVINFDQSDDEAVNVGIKRMQQQFEKRETAVIGEILHIFSLMLMLSEAEAITENMEEVETKSKAYIDDLLASGRLPRFAPSGKLGERFPHSHGGFVFWENDSTSPYFRRIMEYLASARDRALVDEFKSKTPDFLELLTKDGDAFRNMVSYTSSGDNFYADSPILLSIEPKKFVDAWMSAPKSEWYSISRGLKDRYRMGRKELQVEREWITEVIALLNGRAERGEGLVGLRIKRIIPPALQNWHEEEEEESANNPGSDDSQESPAS